MRTILSPRQRTWCRHTPVTPALGKGSGKIRNSASSLHPRLLSVKSARDSWDCQRNQEKKEKKGRRKKKRCKKRKRQHWVWYMIEAGSKRCRAIQPGKSTKYLVSKRREERGIYFKDAQVWNIPILGRGVQSLELACEVLSSSSLSQEWKPLVMISSVNRRLSVKENKGCCSNSFHLGLGIHLQSLVLWGQFGLNGQTQVIQKPERQTTYSMIQHIGGTEVETNLNYIK